MSATDIHSVYALKSNGVIVYIGRSVRVEDRITQHKMSDKDFDSYEVIKSDMPAIEALSLESELIEAHHPIQNRGKSSQGRITTIKRKARNLYLPEELSRWASEYAQYKYGFSLSKMIETYLRDLRSSSTSSAK